MKNLLKKCENCVFGFHDKVDNYYICKPLLPRWIKFELDDDFEYPNLERRIQCEVSNNAAENCEAFRLRETGVNE